MRHAYALGVATSVAAILTYLFCFEWFDNSSAMFAAACVALAFSVTLTASRRWMFTVFLVASLVLTIAIVSRVKFAWMFTTLLASDIPMYLLTYGVIDYVAHEFPKIAAGFFAAIAALAALSVLLYRWDRVEPRALWLGLAGIVVSGSIVALTGFDDAHRDARSDAAENHYRYMHYLGKHHLLAFLRSIGPTIRIQMTGAAMPAIFDDSARGITPFTACKARGKRPHIILVHDESAAPPSIYPAIDYDKGLDRYFQSSDGRERMLQVEVFGGGSHLTIFSVLHGLSPLHLGTNAYMVAELMAGHVREALPDVLKSCGYRTSLFYPFNKQFGRDVRLYEKLDFDDAFYRQDMGLLSFKMPDNTYYEKVTDYVGHRLATTSQPLFVYMQTMNLHAPYRRALASADDAPVSKNSPEIDAYLSGLRASQRDFARFKDELARRFPGEAFLIVRYGDHQPKPYESVSLRNADDTADVTAVSERIRALVPDHEGRSDVLPARRRELSFRDEPQYISYYALDSVNFEIPPIPDYPLLNVAYLSTVSLMAAGIELPDSYARRLELMLLCNGRFFTCPNEAAVLTFHGWLISAGIVGGSADQHRNAARQ